MWCPLVADQGARRGTCGKHGAGPLASIAGTSCPFLPAKVGQLFCGRLLQTSQQAWPLSLIHI
eukprot:238353-Prorocentrum_lima.AAC.1